MSLFATTKAKAKQKQAATKRGGDSLQASKHRELMARKSRDQYAALSDIGELPEVADPERRESCRLDLCRFLIVYFPHSTGLGPFSTDHTEVVIPEMQDCILKGGRRANAVYREFAKTTISENTTIWATLYGHRQFSLLTGINKDASTANLDSIKSELSENDLLLEDFPEVCYPIWKLEGKPQRCASQTYKGKRTLITWRADTIVLPTIPGSKSSGAVIMVKPFAKARGVKHKRSDGANARPDLIIADDVQDDVSAASPLQVQKNLRILKKNLLHTSGHRKSSSVIVNGTVIARGDLMEQLLDDQSWQGCRIKFVRSWSTAHDTFWLKEYAGTRRAYDKALHGDRERAYKEATALYLEKREEADDGCEVSWVERYTRPHEVSAIQHAYNVLIDDGAEVFATEYQNEPLNEETKFKLTAPWIASKTNNLARGMVPKEAEFLSAHIDVHLRLLYYTICAWSKSFDGAVIDYGTYPKQPVDYFAESSAPVAMSNMLPGSAADAWITAGLDAVTKYVLETEFRREDGAALKVGMALVDARWGEKNQLVKQFCRRHPESGVRILAAQGYGIGPAQKAFDEYKPEPGTRTGLAWRIGQPIAGDRWVTVDVNWWKSCVAARLALPVNTPGGIELFGVNPREHALFADHCVSENAVETTAKGRTRDVWEWVIPHHDNHYWDNLVGCAVGAAMLGAQFPEVASKGYRPRGRSSTRLTAAQLAALARR